MVFVLILFIGFLKPSNQIQDFNFDRYKDTYKSKDIADRIIKQMWTYHIEADRRIAELNPQRFMFEETPHYEQGYVFAEIIERYKKMVEHLKRLLLMKNAQLHDHLDKLERMQKNYFEVQQLVNMMHEVKPKYRMEAEFKHEGGDGTFGAGELAALKARAEFLQAERNRYRAKKDELARKRKMRDKSLASGNWNTSAAHRIPGSRPEPYNNRWPLDYGWEINEDW